MKKYSLILLVVVLGLLLVACGGGDTPVAEPVVEEPAVVEEVVEEVAEEVVEAVEEVAEEVEEVVEEVVEEAVVEPITAEGLDAAYGTFVSNLEGYNALKDFSLLNEQLASDSPPFLLDLRTPGELEELGHIEGAVNIPLRELAQNIDLLPSFDTPIVTYCKAGWRAAIGMTALEAMGWENVKALHAPSYTGWAEEGYPTVEGLAAEAMVLNAASPDPAMVKAIDDVLVNFADNWNGIDSDGLATEIVENPDLILVDVRTPGEVEAGTIDAPNVVAVALDDFIGMQDQWPADKDAPIVTYCKAGHRSTVAMTILKSYGYTNVRSLKGGYVAYSAAEYPLAGVPEPEADLDTAYGDFIANMEGYNALKDFSLLNEWLAEDPPPFILDVRNPAELEEFGHIEGAVNIPLKELAQHTDLLPDFDTHIVTYCKAGWRAAIAMTVLGGMGYTDVQALHPPSYTGWVEEGYATVEGLAADPLVLDVAAPDSAIVEVLDATLVNYPDNWGGIDADGLATEIVENPDLILIDVRTPGEVETSVIDAPNLIWATLDDFIGVKDQWPEDKDAPIVTYCKAGHRSTVAMTILRAYGYTNVRSLKGGFVGWENAEYPVAEFVAQ